MSAVAVPSPPGYTAEKERIHGPRAEEQKERRRGQAKFRRAVLKRDNYTCMNCGRHLSELEEGEFLIADHIIPLSLGGTNDIDNGRTLCSTCEPIVSEHPMWVSKRVRGRRRIKPGAEE